MGGLFQYKDTLDKGMGSAVVYKYCCPKCGALALPSMPESVFVLLVFPFFFFFLSDFIFKKTLFEKLSLSNHSPSHIREHSHSCGGPRVSLSQFNIIGRCSNIINLRILESLHILKNEPK